jgi:hypothetical protein
MLRLVIYLGIHISTVIEMLSCLGALYTMTYPSTLGAVKYIRDGKQPVRACRTRFPISLRDCENQGN